MLDDCGWDDENFDQAPSPYTEKHWRFAEVVEDGRHKLVCNSEVHMDILCERWSDLTRNCQSPIETELACELFHLWTLQDQRAPFIIWPREERHPKMGYTIAPQHPIGPYRADLAIHLFENETDHGGDGLFNFDTLPHTYRVRLVVECDGHDFHEKTKEQAARDKKRDRYFLTQGWPVIRFTGAEIKADPAGCARQVHQTVRALLAQQIKATEDLRRHSKIYRQNYELLDRLQKTERAQ